MVDLTECGDLPTPAQMRTFLAASRAAWQARRMREASRASITGNLALGICLMGAVLVLMHSHLAGDAAPFLACGLIYGYLGLLFFSWRWRKRQLAHSPVTVLDAREEALTRATSRPWKAGGIFLLILAFQVVCGLGWSLAFRHLSNGGILACLSIGPLMGIGYFVLRFVQFQFWEDLLFAACVALAYAPFFLQAWQFTWLSFVSLVLVVVGAISLHTRWSTWTQAVASASSEEEKP